MNAPESNVGSCVRASHSGGRGRALEASFFVAWSLIALAVGAWLVEGHRSGAKEGLQALRLTRLPGATRALYFLGSDCGLSQTVADALSARGPSRVVAETVVLRPYDAVVADQLRHSGYTVSSALPPEFAGHLTVRVSPWLAIIDARDHVLFSGSFSAAAETTTGENSGAQTAAARAPWRVPSSG